MADAKYSVRTDHGTMGPGTILGPYSEKNARTMAKKTVAEGHKDHTSATVFVDRGTDPPLTIATYRDVGGKVKVSRPDTARRSPWR